jgi:hypothetical protein
MAPLVLRPLRATSSGVSADVRQASMLSAPQPHSCTFPATDPARGFRATTTGSNAGFSAVPHPAHSLAAAVAGAVTLLAASVVAYNRARVVAASRPFGHLPPRAAAASSSATVENPSRRILPVTPRGCRFAVGLGPTIVRCAPAALSMALPTSSDFGNPDPYSHAMLSRISNPASSTAHANRW